MVVVTVGLVGAIAVPRLSNAAERSKANAVTGNLAVMTKAIELYTAEHNDLSPAHDDAATVNTSGVQFCLRLMRPTDEFGTVSVSGLFGPYLLDIPKNPYNDRRTVRIDGSPLPSGHAGWRFDSDTRALTADHTNAVGHVGVEAEGAGIEG